MAVKIPFCFFMLGETLDAKYRIDKQLGAGGMGNVYLATHLGTTRAVAVKVIAPRWAAEPHFLARFQREAQACGRLRHPNIINVTDFGVAKTAQGDVAYLVMEYLDGQTLSDFQEANPHIALTLIADLLDQIGLALTEAHRRGIVHRDLKPDNIWLEPNGRGGFTVKVLDFGVAKVNLLDPASSESSAERSNGLRTNQVESPPRGDELETLALDGITTVRTTEEIETIAIAPTHPSGSSGSFDSGSAQTVQGSLLGTPAYMSPEQALGQAVDFRSDIYSLAVVAYSMVCGELPFKGKSSRELIAYHQSSNPSPSANIRKKPPDVADAILVGLARNPEDRPSSATEWARRFHNAVDVEFLGLRRSKSFLLQHLGSFTFLLTAIYAGVLSATALLLPISRSLVPSPEIRSVLVPIAAAILFIFFDNLLRAVAALIAVDECAGIRRFSSLRVFGRLFRILPVLFVTQTMALLCVGRGWITGDCLWPVVCVVEGVSGRVSIIRSRNLMTGLRSAGSALAIRHFSLAAFAVCQAALAIGIIFKGGEAKQANLVLTAVWFPILAPYAAAPLFLYDRTVASESGPLLQLDRTPDVRTSASALSASSLVWLLTVVIYILYQSLRLWVPGR
jgi:serine/threonine protein kinase